MYEGGDCSFSKTNSAVTIGLATTINMGQYTFKTKWILCVLVCLEPRQTKTQSWPTDNFASLYNFPDITN